MKHLERIVDGFPKSRQLAGSPYGQHVAAALQRLLPERGSDDRAAILRGIVRHRLLNRAIYLAHMAAPRIGDLMARLVPVDVPADVARLVRADAPFIIASAHCGPLFLHIVVLRRLLRERRVIVVLRHDALYLRRAIPFLKRMGCDYIIDNERSVRSLIATLSSQPKTVVLFAFDHTHAGRRVVPFLAANITTSNGIAFIADGGRAQIVMSLWRWQGGRARIALTGPYGVDEALPAAERRSALLARLYDLLEARVAEAPEQWSGWEYIEPRIVDVQPPNGATFLPASGAVGKERTISPYPTMVGAAAQHNAVDAAHAAKASLGM